MKYYRSLLWLLPFLLFFSNRLFSQASACPSVNAGPDQNTCPGDCVNLTATVQGSVATTAYTVSTIPYNPYPFTGGNPILLNIDDTWSGVIPMPFCFQFFGNTYSQMVIGSNACITFDLAVAGGYCEWQILNPIPSPVNPTNSIMAPYHDIDPSVGTPGGAAVNWQIYGTAPCREFVINWYNVAMYSCTNLIATSQLVLHETTNIIDIYIANKPSCPTWNAGAAIQGIQDATGTTAYAVTGRNFPIPWSATNDGQRFMPSGTSNYTLSWFGPSGFISNAATINVCPATTTTYTATVTNTSCNGNVVVNDLVTVNTSGPISSFAQTNIICNGSCTGSASVTVTGAGPYTYLWLPAPGGGQGTPTATGLCSGTYSCTVSTPGGCASTQTFLITQPPLLTATQSQVNLLCNGVCNGSASVVASGGTGIYSYNWVPAPGGGQGTANATSLCAGNYTCTISSPVGCSITKTFSITQPPAITIATSFVSADCGVNNGSATVTPSGGTGAFTYSWNTTPVQTTQTATNIGAGNYVGTVTDAAGCTSSANVNIPNTNGPTVTLNTVNAVTCFGVSDGSADITVSGGTAPYGYSWSSTPVQTTEDLSGVPAGSYTCTITDFDGCLITQDIIVTQPTAITLTTSGSDVSCFGSCDGQVSVLSTGGTGSYSYNWNTLCTTPACSNVCQGSYSVTVTDANGCSATATVSITEPASINISTTVTASNCSHADGSATASASGGVGTFSYQWLNGGPAAATWNNISGGTYIIVVTDQNNCADSSTVFVNNQPGVTASVSSITNVLCNGQSTGEIICTASNGAPAYTYVWSAPATGTTGTASNLPAGSYTLTVSDANGCATTVTAVVTEPPLLTVSAIATPTTVCSGSSVTVNGSATGGTPGYNYEWNPGNLNGATQTLAPVSTTTFIITATDANGCMATFNVPVNVNPVPVPVVLTNLNSGCAPLCVNFTDMSTVSAPGVITSWSWNYEAGTSSVQNPSYCFTSAGSYDVSLIVTTSDGCSDTVSFINYIGVYPDPVAGFSFQPVDSGGMSSQITFTDASTGAVSWLWNFGDDIGTSVQQHPAYNYPYAECYDATLTVTSAEGCMDTATMQVCIEADFVIYIPNAFTPNGDQLNDVFMPLGEGFDPAQFEIWIFNRWGNLIYHSTDMEKGWDGHMNGSSELCQVDTYAWRISVADLQGKTYNLLGKVALIR